LQDFSDRTGLPLTAISAQLRDAQQRGWLHHDPQQLHTTALGQRFLNDVIASFLA
jgi:oxygen-independent coproporphyrinogen-3 oxidase